MKYGEKKKIVGQIQSEMERYYDKHLAESGQSIGKYCVYWAYFTLKVLKEKGFTRAQAQGGSAYWPIISEENDDGVSPNAFGYEFTPNNHAIATFAMGDLPEMHAWVAILHSEAHGEIVDLTVPYFKENAIEKGFQYSAPNPPDFFWDSRIPKYGVVYRPNMMATAICYRALMNTFPNSKVLMP